MSVNEMLDLFIETSDMEAEPYFGLGSLALFEYCEMTATEAANDDAYENLYPFIS